MDLSGSLVNHLQQFGVKANFLYYRYYRLVLQVVLQVGI